EYEKAFAQGDAKTVASFWTENGEISDADGTWIRGRANIEPAFAEFFKSNPHAKIEVLIESIRFPAENVGVEEGIMRQSVAGKHLPTTTEYVAVHCRDKDRWRIATSREWGAEQHRLIELEWLLGNWTARVGDNEMTIDFAKDPKKPVINGEFT